MPLAVSFYRPVDYFSGFFNRFVTWMTSGDYCHCELVVHTTPHEIMDTVKHIYEAAQKGEYAPEDSQRIIAQIEMAFFDTHFRKKAQTSEQMTLSFSFLWGHPMTVRVLSETAHDSWFKIPSAGDTNAVLVSMPEVTEEQQVKTLRFAIEELGKQYDTSGALCSWLPLKDSSPKMVHETYFCSEFVVTAFQRIGFLQELSALHTTPNSLFKHMPKE